MRGTRFVDGGTLADWGVLVVADQRAAPQQNVERFLVSLCRMAQQVGLNVMNDRPPIVTADPRGRDLEERFAQLRDRVGNMRFVLVVVPGGTDIYCTLNFVFYHSVLG
jgi:hypothetical protein